MSRSDFHALQIWRVRSSESRPAFQFHSSGIETRLEAAREQFLVARQGAGGGGRIDDPLDDDEAVFGEGLHLRVVELEFQCRLSRNHLEPAHAWCR